MSFFIKHLVLHQMKQLSVAQILQYAHSYELSIQPSEAKKIHHLIQTTDFDPLSLSDHEYLFQQVEQITDSSTAQNAKDLLYGVIEEHGFTKHLYT